MPLFKSLFVTWLSAGGTSMRLPID